MTRRRTDSARNDGRCSRARRVTCTGCCGLCSGRGRCGTQRFPAGARGRPARGRRPPQVRRGSASSGSCAGARGGRAARSVGGGGGGIVMEAIVSAHAPPAGQGPRGESPSRNRERACEARAPLALSPRVIPRAPAPGSGAIVCRLPAARRRSATGNLGGTRQRESSEWVARPTALERPGRVVITESPRARFARARDQRGVLLGCGAPRQLSSPHERAASREGDRLGFEA
jgi:hypothetical protein